MVGEFVDPASTVTYDIMCQGGQQTLRRRRTSDGQVREREHPIGRCHHDWKLPANWGAAGQVTEDKAGSLDLLWALTEGPDDKGSQFQKHVDFVSVAPGLHSLALVIRGAQGLQQLVDALDAESRKDYVKSFFYGLPTAVLGTRSPHKFLWYTDLAAKCSKIKGERDRGAQGVHLNPLGLFLRTSILFIWRILSAFLPN